MALLVLVVAIALAFDFTNGFHDTANYIAAWVGTRALSPRPAVLISAAANLAGAFVTTAVATTVGKGIIDTGLATQQTTPAARPRSALGAGCLEPAGGVGRTAVELDPCADRRSRWRRARTVRHGGGGRVRALAKGHRSGGRIPRKRLRGSVRPPHPHLLALPATHSGCREPRVPHRPALFWHLGRLHARRERRAEDDGRDRTRPLYARLDLELLHPELGQDRGGTDDRGRDV